MAIYKMMQLQIGDYLALSFIGLINGHILSHSNQNKIDTLKSTIFIILGYEVNSVQYFRGSIDILFLVL